MRYVRAAWPTRPSDPSRPNPEVSQENRRAPRGNMLVLPWAGCIRVSLRRQQRIHKTQKGPGASPGASMLWLASSMHDAPRRDTLHHC